MAIDSSALTSINNAIDSYSNDKSSYKDKINRQLNDHVSDLSKKAALAAGQSRYQAAFEEKMKLANGSKDTVEISSDSLEALKKYNSNRNEATDANKTSSSSGYTYDYQAIKKKNLENLAAIEKDVAARYGKKQVAESDTKNTETTASSDVTAATSTGTSSVKENTDTQKSSSTEYGYDYSSVKEQDKPNSATTQSEVNAQYSGKNSPDSIVG